MATPFELMQAMPNGLFDKRTWSPKARDEFAKRLLEEEAMRKFDSESRLEAQRQSSMKERELGMIQRQHDLAEQSKDKNEDKLKQGVRVIAEQKVKSENPALSGEDLYHAAEEEARIMYGELVGKEAPKASREVMNDIQGAGVERRLYPYVAKGAEQQALLNDKKYQDAIADYPKQHEAQLTALEKEIAFNKAAAAEPALYSGNIGNLLMNLARVGYDQNPASPKNILTGAQTKEAEAKAAKDNADAAVKQNRADFLNELKGGNKPTGRIKIVNGDIVTETPTNAPVRVNDTSAAVPSTLPFVNDLANRLLKNKTANPPQ